MNTKKIDPVKDVMNAGHPAVFIGPFPGGQQLYACTPKLSRRKARKLAYTYKGCSRGVRYANYLAGNDAGYFAFGKRLTRTPLVQRLPITTLHAADIFKLANGIDTPDCPKCGGQTIAPTRQGMSLPYKCTSCGQSFSMVFAMSDLSRLKEAYAGEADTILANTNAQIVFKPSQP